MHIYKQVAIEFSRSLVREPSSSRTFIWLILLNYKRARHSKRECSCNSSSLVTSCMRSSNKTIAVVSRIANSCVGQAVIVLIIIASVKCEQWHKSSENLKWKPFQKQGSILNCRILKVDCISWKFRHHTW